MDLHIASNSWQHSLDTDNNQAIQEAPPLASIYAICSDFYCGLLKALCDEDTIANPVLLSLQRSQSYLVLWAESFGVVNGDLDKSIHKSRRARRLTYRLLLRIAQELTHRLLPLVPKNRRQLLSFKASNLTQAMTRLRTLAKVDDALASDSDSDSDISSDDATVSLDDIAEDLRIDTRSLFDLGSRFQEPKVGSAHLSAGLQDPAVGFAEKARATINKSARDLAKSIHFGDHVRIHLGDNYDSDRLDLPTADGAAFDSQAEQHGDRCHPGTRTDLLRQIEKWADDPGSRCMFWLNGMAGTGKSTISRTIAERLSQKGTLGASFFFKRGESDRGTADRFFTTIATQLATKTPIVDRRLREAVRNDRRIGTKNFEDQLDKLILQPLREANDFETHTLVIVVDALDECDGDDNAIKDSRRLIQLLSRLKDVKQPHLKVFLTSRPELPIRLGFTYVQGTYEDLVLHKVPESIIRHDIYAFLVYEMGQIREEYNRSVMEDRHLRPEWPGEADIQKLVDMAIPLFIFAATVCRFIAERRGGDPATRLQDFLEYRNSNEESELDATYLPVLKQLINGLSPRRQEEVLRNFRHVVGSIVVLANPLSVPALAQLLNMGPEKVWETLDLLHSVLSVPSGAEAPIKLLHLSFRDFLLDQTRPSDGFSVNETDTHERLAADCLRLIQSSLRMNICALEDPGALFTEVEPRRISDALRPEVQYACRFWVYHLAQSQAVLSDDSEAYSFLTTHFLHWLEALSWIRRASESLSMLDVLRDRIDAYNGSRLLAFVQDTRRFTSATMFQVELAPLQIYSSGLIFTPKRSIIRTTFESGIPEWVKLQPRVEDSWDACERTLEGHSGPVTSVAFSADGAVVASASDDRTVRLWNAKTGALQQTLQGHSGWVTSVAFSADGAVVASASHDRTVRLWNAKTGALQQTLQGHSGWVTSVAFSADDAVVASASGDRTVRLWNAKTGALQQILQGHSGPVSSVAFSADDAVVASASDDWTVRLWNAKTGALQQTLQGHSGWVSSVAFSADDAVVASASGDRTVRLWNAKTATCFQTVNVGTTLQGLSFSEDSSSLFTDVGTITIASRTQSVSTSLTVDNTASTRSPAPFHLRKHRLGYRISEDRCWITYDGRNMIWLPADVRPGESAVYGSTVALGNRSGKITIMRFA